MTDSTDQRPRTEDEYSDARNRIAGTLAGMYYAIYHIWLEDRTYVCFHEELPGVLAAIGERGEFVPAWKTYIDNYIVEEDRPGVRAFADIETLADRLMGSPAITHEYRRLEVGWTRGQFIVAERDSDGTPTHLIYAVLDVNSEHEREQREEKALYAATHDALSHALNREAFDRDVDANAMAGRETGFVLIDIDNFKNLNDECGHEVGDAMIATVASELTSSLHEGDRVYRVGGDEFALVLHDCTSSVWHSLCRKIRRIHASLASEAPQDMRVTLSAGVCFGTNGLEGWMYEAADQGLYNTKRSGRAGCTLVGRDGTIFDSWRDEVAANLLGSAMVDANSGTSRLEICLDGSRPSRMYCGKALRMIYDLPEDAGPEECFRLWKEGIDPSYLETLRRALDEMVTHGNVETSFVWHHPTKGDYLIRCIGSGHVEGSLAVVSGIHRSLEGAMVVERDDDARLILEAQDAINFCSIYLDVDTGRVLRFKLGDKDHQRAAEGMDARQAFDAILAHDVREEDQERIAAFLDLSTVDARIGEDRSVDCEFHSTTSKGWCRARWLPVRRDEGGHLTHALFCIATIDAAMQERIEADLATTRLMRLHYDAAESILNTRILGISLIDSKTRESHSWKVGEDGLEPDPRSYEECVASLRYQIAPVARGRYDTSLNIGRVLAEVERNGSYEVESTLGEKGEERVYVKNHFGPFRHVPGSVICVTEDATSLHKEEGRSVEDLFDNVPGGLAAIEWDGQEFEVLSFSNYYRRLYGWRVERDERGVARPDFTRIHQADRAAYVADLVATATGGQEMHRTARMWNNRIGTYSWIKMDAVAHPLDNGHTLIYATYSDVTDLTEARRELAKTTDSLNAALSTASQLFYEYDPLRHVATCFSDENFFGLPKRIEDYPASLRGYDLFHPEDAHVFYECIAKMEGGDERSQCDMRFKGTDGEYRWYSCLFTRRRDDSLGRDLIVILVVDVTLRVAASEAANDRSKALFEANDDILGVTNIDLTNNRVTCVRRKDPDFLGFEVGSDYDEALRHTARGIVSPSLAEDFLETFESKALLAAYASGTTRVTHKGLYRVTPERTEWVESVSELYLNPATQNVVAVSYSRIMTQRHFSEQLTNQWLATDYPSSAIVLDQGREFFLFDAGQGAYCKRMLGFWDTLEEGLARTVGAKEAKKVVDSIDPKKIMSQMGEGRTLEYGFDVEGDGRGDKDDFRRYLLRFSPVDDALAIFQATLKAVGDEGMYERLRFEAKHDAVTGLYNRHALFESCERLLEDHPDVPFSLLKIDVRRFRLYNSFFGEEAGDELLRTIADGVRELCSEYPFSAYGRVEADVFCAMFPTNEKTLARHLEYVGQQFASYCDDFLLEPLVGIYDVTDRSLSIEAMLARATTAAKAAAPGSSDFVHHYDEDMDRRLDSEMELIREMQPALNQNQFVPYLQPKFDFATGRIEGAEALVRWVNPTRGMVSPAEFIPLFETNGFIAKLDRYMWESVCKILAGWRDAGLPVLPISVNVSRVSACHTQTIPFLVDLVGRYGLDPSLLELELTESAYIDDPIRMRRQLAELRERGFKILMDDFGSGYSSLNTLRELPVDTIKLDRMFLSETCADQRGRTVLSSMVEMAKRLGLPVVAEGVETEEQAAYLASLGCEYAQGFLFARPMPVGEYERLLKENLDSHER